MGAEHIKPYQYREGTSGNPGGRPKGLERTIREAIAKREWTDAGGTVHRGLDAVLARLFELLFEKGTTPRDAVAIAKELFDRGWGKAKQKVEVAAESAAITTMPRDPAEMSDDEVREALDAIGTLKRLAVVHGDTEH